MVVTRKCIVCGKEFEYSTRRSRTRFAKKNKYPCCDECKDVLETTNRSDVLSQYGAKKMKQPPILADKMFVIDVLYDFGIFVDSIPDFKSTYELFRWKDELIKTKLNEV